MAKKTTRRTQVIPEGENKSARFSRVVTPRVCKAVKAIDVIGFCTGSSYEHTPAQAKQICDILRSTVDGLESKFAGEGVSSGSFQLTK